MCMCMCISVSLIKYFGSLDDEAPKLDRHGTVSRCSWLVRDSIRDSCGRRRHDEETTDDEQAFARVVNCRIKNVQCTLIVYAVSPTCAPD